MQAIILAGGHGTRMGELTRDKPKTLLEVGGSPILATIIDNLPDIIDEIILVSQERHREAIYRFALSHPEKRKVIMATQSKDLQGTYGALCSAKEYIKNGTFLVLNSDDFIDKQSLTEATRHPFAMVFAMEKPPSAKYLSYKVNSGGYVESSTKSGQTTEAVLLYTGAMCIDERIWLLSPVRNKKNEYGLPQTVAPILQQAVAVVAKNWKGFNTKEDIAS